MIRRRLLAIATVSLLTSSACAEASGEIRAGERLDLSAPEFAGEELRDAGVGTTWSSLFRDFFGPEGIAKCAAVECHGSPSGRGALSSGGILCETPSGCRQSMFDKGLIQPPDDITDPRASGLFSVLRHRDLDGGTTGFMPPRFIFSTAELARIDGWMRAGAKDD